MPRHVHPKPFVIKPPADFVEKHPELRRVSHALSILFAGGVQKKEGMVAVVTDENLQAMGGALWQALGAQDDFEQAHKEAGAAILPIIIETEQADAQALPWETLHHPTLGFLGTHKGFTLSRRMGEPTAEPAKLEKGPLRVLLFTPLPDDVDPEHGRLNVEEEQIQVQEALMPWISQGLVELEMPDDGRFETLKALLDSFHPHVLFLSGHGVFHDRRILGEPSYGEFLFEGETGGSRPVREEAIAGALVGMGVRLVVLSACESAKNSPSDELMNGLTQRLSSRHIPHVIGMRESIYDAAGIKFARALCDNLAGQEQVDSALQYARIAIQTPFKDDIPRRESGLAAAEELSFGQWCLPMLVSPAPHVPLIDWDFAPQKTDTYTLNRMLDTVSMPARFIGRRAEMRTYKTALQEGKLRKLLITGPGGQGKTSLAGKLALDLQARGFKVFAWSARPENPWRDFELEAELALDEARAKNYDRFKARVDDPAAHAKRLFRLLMERYDGRVLFFFDNLETIQHHETRALNDPLVDAWLAAAQAEPDLRLLVTSRWQTPNWGGEHLPLERAGYGDFLQMAQRAGLPHSFLKDRSRLRRVYEVLGGNSRGLEFFAAAARALPPQDEDDFLKTLDGVKSDTQADMAIETIYKRLPAAAQTALRRLPAYREPVPLEGLLKLTLDLPDPEALIQRLLAFSLLEAHAEPRWDAVEYQPAPLVTDWLEGKGLTDDDPRWRNAAADYHLYLLARERDTLPQAVTTHHALRRAGRHAEANRLTLDDIVGPLTMKGFYRTLLDEWLARICESEDGKTRAEALGQTGKLHLHLGMSREAMPYFQQSLAIMQQIGDKAGEGTTLNNISQIFKAQGDYETALSYLKQSLAIRQQIGDKAGEGTTLNNISQIFKAQGDYETALSYLKQSLAIMQQIGDKAGEGTTLNNISALYHAQGDYETALSYLKQSLAIRQQIGDKAGEGTTLNNISQIYDAQGDYETALSYLKQSLAIMQQIGDKAGEGTTLNNISQIYDAQGDYETALSYLKQSLAIRQQIGDKAGLCATLFNMGHIHMQNKQVQEAVSAWVAVYAIAKQINEFQALQALSKLAPQLGLPEGLEGWEMLAQRTADDGPQTVEKDPLEQVREFMRGLVKAAREKLPEAQKYFESVSKMAADPQAPPELQELGRVLQKYMSGVKNPNLSNLPEELAKLVEEELGE
jgi:tetratricopeptide (TPR) repeat protein